MVTDIVRRRCSHCTYKVLVISPRGEPYLCPNCLRFFRPSVPGVVPAWVWGVVTLLFWNVLAIQ